MQFAHPEPFTSAQIEGAKELRKRLANILPPSFNTDFFLARWYRAYNGDFDLIITRIKELITHRRIIGYDKEDDLLECVTKFEFSKLTFERFAVSQLNAKCFSNDVVVFLQKMQNVDIKEIVKVIPLGHVLNSYFLLQEFFHQAMHKHELKTGRPSAAVIVIDLSGLIVSDFLNPLSSSSKLARYVVKIWSEFFSENLIKLYLLNPPAIVSIMWQIAKQIVDAKTQSRVIFLQKIEDLHKFLAKEKL